MYFTFFISNVSGHYSFISFMTLFMQLLHLCEAESISYLDEVASSPESLDLAKSVSLEVGVLELFKNLLEFDDASILTEYRWC